jgi:hypothetical protein
MPTKRFNAEQIVTLLRQIGVSMAQGGPNRKLSLLGLQVYNPDH